MFDAKFLIFASATIGVEWSIAALMAGQMLTKVVRSIVPVPLLIDFFVKLGRWLEQNYSPSF